VREEALKVVRLLDVPEALVTLKNMYEGETYNNQLAIIEILSLTPDQSNMDFFEKVIQNGDQNQRIQAARGLLALGQAGWLKIEHLSKSNQYDLINIITHVKDIYG
jgi:HEAT repeat protein